jgi:hypothetical protein
MASTIIQPAEVVNGGQLRPAPLNARFDEIQVSPHIALAERSHVLPVLGSAFYQYIIVQKAGIVSNYNPNVAPIVQAFPLNPALEKLWTEYLMEFCASAALLEALPFIAAKIGSNGISYGSNNLAEPTGLAEARFFMDSVRNRLQKIGELTLLFLCENKADYPNFDYKKQCINCCDCSTWNNTTIEDCSNETKPNSFNPLGIIFY